MTADETANLILFDTVIGPEKKKIESLFKPNSLAVPF